MRLQYLICPIYVPVRNVQKCYFYVPVHMGMEQISFIKESRLANALNAHTKAADNMGYLFLFSVPALELGSNRSSGVDDRWAPFSAFGKEHSVDGGSGRQWSRKLHGKLDLDAHHELWKVR